MNPFGAKNFLAQSDVDFANFKATRANLIDYAGAGLTWNTSTKKFDTVGGGGGVSLGEFINVKNPPYNAAGNGTTDDSAAINTAMADVVSAGGGTVFFPKGIYLCNNPPDPTVGSYNSVLGLPFMRDLPSKSLLLLGEVDPPHSVSTAFDIANAATIKTTQTGSGTTPALLAGESAFGDTGSVPYEHRNSLWLTIKNLNFVLPDNPTLYGLRLDRLGITSLENVTVIGGGGSAEPTHGTVGIWTPNTINWGINDMKNVQVFGFDTGIRTYEHLRGFDIQVGYCKTGVAFGPASYPSWANIVVMACNNGIGFFGGNHSVNLLVANEHSPAPPWVVVASDINDPSNFGSGYIKHFIGAGGSGGYSPATVIGGAGLTILELAAGHIKLATGGVVGGAIITGKGTIPPGGTVGQHIVKTGSGDYQYGWGT